MTKVWYPVLIASAFLSSYTRQSVRHDLRLAWKVYELLNSYAYLDKRSTSLIVSFNMRNILPLYNVFYAARRFGNNQRTHIEIIYATQMCSFVHPSRFARRPRLTYKISNSLVGEWKKQKISKFAWAQRSIARTDYKRKECFNISLERCKGEKAGDAQLCLWKCWKQ